MFARTWDSDRMHQLRALRTLARPMLTAMAMVTVAILVAACNKGSGGSGY